MQQMNDPQIVESSDLAGLRAVLAHDLENRHGLKAETVEAMSIGALAAQYAGSEGTTTDPMHQSPETGSGLVKVASLSRKWDALDASERSEVESELSKARKIESRLPERAAAIREEQAEALGVSEPSELSEIDALADL